MKGLEQEQVAVEPFKRIVTYYALRRLVGLLTLISS